MAEFRFVGTSTAGKPVRGVLNAANPKEAKTRLAEMEREHRFKLEKVEKRGNYKYKVRKPGEKAVIQGAQKAYAKEDVTLALQKLGYEVVSVNRDVIDFKPKPNREAIITFVRIAADLMREKLPYADILQFLIADTSNKAMREILIEVNGDLKKGVDGKEAFMKHVGGLGKFTAFMLGVASKSGNMAEIYDNTAKFLERQAEFKKNIRQALVQPIITLVLLFGAVGFYVGYIFPKTAELFVKYKFKLPPMTKATLAFSNFLQDNIWYIILPFVIAVWAVLAWFRTDKGAMWRDRNMLKIPVMGDLIHKTSIEIFCRVFYSLYSGSGENIEVIRVAAEATDNRYMEKQIKTVSIPLMLQQGAGLVESLAASQVFTQTALSRFRTGAETGAVRKAAQQLANYYEKDTGYRMKSVIDGIQLFVAAIIFIVMLFLTLVSSETAVIQRE